MQASYDIVIVGGGMVGLSLACMLAQKTALSIAVLEEQTQIPSWSAEHVHHRVSAIALSSQKIFQSLGVWNDIREKRVSPFKQIIAWDAATQAEIVFHSNEMAESKLGYIIENNLMHSVLENKIKNYPQITKFSGIKLTTMIEHEHEHGMELVADDGRIIKAKLAIAADGGNSWLRKQAGIEIDKLDYEENAIVAAVQTTLPHLAGARQIFLPTGPLAFLPLSEKQTSSIVWSLPIEETKRLMALNENDFCAELGSAFEYRLGDVISSSKRFTFPLMRQKANKYIKPHIALVGDAAHTIHPLAGQGVNMGLLDAACLADVICEAVKEHRSFSSEATLRRYERWRKADNLMMFAGVDLIKNLFSSDKKSIQNLRSFGLNTVNHLKWMKNIFVRHAVGERNDLPSLAR
jgi:2-octaprenylphenol hydroxylase